MISSLEEAEPFINEWKVDSSKVDILASSTGIALSCTGKITQYDGSILVFSNTEVNFEFQLLLDLVKQVEFMTPDEAASIRARNQAYADKQECIWSFDTGEACVVLFGPKPEN